MIPEGKAREIGKRIKLGTPYTVTNRERMIIWIEEALNDQIEETIHKVQKYFFDRAHEYDVDGEELQRNLMLYHSGKLVESIRELKG